MGKVDVLILLVTQPTLVLRGEIQAIEHLNLPEREI